MKGSPSQRRAVFADRDGTIIEDHHYIADPARVTLIPGAADALLRLRGLGFALVIVTNQSGIGRGLYTLSDYRRVAAEVERQSPAPAWSWTGRASAPTVPAATRKPPAASRAR